MDLVEKLSEILRTRNVFLSGGAGVGKSYLTAKLKAAFKAQGKMVATLGSTAISAFNVGGVTLHSFFALGVCASADELLRQDKKQRDKVAKLRKVLKMLDLIIIDEISMVSAEIFELVAMRLRNSEFAGRLLVVGDFFQLPPVFKKEQGAVNSLFGGLYAFGAVSWRDFAFQNVRLNIAKRTSHAEFYAHLSAMREGKISEKMLDFFENLRINAAEFESLNDDFTLLCGINQKVDAINSRKLAQLFGKEVEFRGVLEVYKAEFNDNEKLQKWVKSLNIHERLVLKVGARVIFCVNNYEADYFNGEQGEVVGFVSEDGVRRVRIRKDSGVEITLAPYTFYLQNFADEDERVASFAQFPVKLAYAITIHKSQGMSIRRLVCDIDHIFENGQLYVALSRAIEPQNLHILYTRSANFREYFKNALKFDRSVLEFYKKAEFVDLE